MASGFMQRFKGKIQAAQLYLQTGGLFYESFTDTITAAATQTQAAATALTSEINRVTTSAAAGNGVKLPASAPGLSIMVINHGANPIQVYGLSADTIDDATNTVGVTQMQGSVAFYMCATAGAWYSEGIGTGYSGSLPTFSNTDGITASATQTQAAGTQLTTAVNRVVTVASAGNAVKLPASAPGLEITVINAHATNAIGVFATNPDVINALTTTTAFSVAATKVCTFFCTTAGQWHSQLSA